MQSSNSTKCLCTSPARLQPSSLLDHTRCHTWHHTRCHVWHHPLPGQLTSQHAGALFRSCGERLKLSTRTHKGKPAYWRRCASWSAGVHMRRVSCGPVLPLGCDATRLPAGILPGSCGAQKSAAANAHGQVHSLLQGPGRGGHSSQTTKTNPTWKHAHTPGIVSPYPL